MSATSQKLIKVGDKFATNNCGDVTVIQTAGEIKITVMFSDGNTKACTSGALRLGKVKNDFLPYVYGMGFKGEGEFCSRRSSTQTSLEYAAWHGMLMRCYCPKMLAKRPTYAGCSVTPEWLNFQTFARWYTSQSTYGKGFELDKDLTIPGNKLYSPETCCLVPGVVNMALHSHKEQRGAYPQGVTLHKKNRSFRAKTYRPDGSIKQGSFATPELAFASYKVIKEVHVKEVAMKYKQDISEAIYNNLMAYTVSITD